MGLFDAVSGLFDSSASTDVSDLANSGLAGDLLGGLSSLSSLDPGTPANLNGGGFSMNATPYPMPVAASVPMVARAASAGIARWSVQFPSLWQALQRYRGAGIAMTIGKLWSMFKKVGPTVLASYIGAQAVADLVTYKATHKNRRMNVANTRALGRSLRRLKGFDRLAHRVSAQLARASHGRRRSSSRGRCMTCRKSPCSC